MGLVSHSRSTHLSVVSGDMFHDPEQDKAITEDERMNEFRARCATLNYSSRVLQNTVPVFSALETAETVHQYTLLVCISQIVTILS